MQSVQFSQLVQYTDFVWITDTNFTNSDFFFSKTKVDSFYTNKKQSTFL